DLLAVGCEEWTTIVAGHVREATLSRAVGAHDVDFGEIARIPFELLLLLVGQLAVVRVAHRREDDPLAVWRVAAFGVVPPRLRQSLERAGFFAVRVDVHLRVVVPGVAALLARCAKRELLLLVLLRFRIGMRRGEFDLVGARAEECARCLTDSRRNALRLP